MNPAAYSASLKPIRFNEPGDIVIRRRAVKSDTYEELVLRPVQNGFVAFDANGNPATLTQAQMLEAAGSARADLGGVVSQIALIRVAPKMQTGTVALLGDSKTVATFANTVDTQDFQYQGLGWFGWTQFYLGHQLTPIYQSNASPTFAVNGYKASDIIEAGLHTAAAASSAECVIVNIGTNEHLNGIDLETHMANVSTIVSTLIAAGKRVVLLGLDLSNNTTGGATETAARRALLNSRNDRYRSLAQSVGALFVDIFAATFDPSTARMNAGYTYDNTHYNQPGASRVGYAVAETLRPLLPPTPAWLFGAPMAANTDANIGGIIATNSANPYMLGDESGEATAINVISSGGGSHVADKLARDDGIPGAWQRVAVTTGTPASQFAQVTFGSPSVAVGQRVRGVVELRGEASGWDARAIGLTLQSLSTAERRRCFERSAQIASATLPIMRPSVSAWLVTPSMLMPAGNTQMQLTLQLAGSATWLIGRHGIMPTDLI